MKRPLALLLLAVVLGSGCSAGGTGSRPAGRGDLDKLKVAMTGLFSALEMYAHDHSLAYPETAQALLPKYIDAIPTDPMTGTPLIYTRTESGYMVSTDGDYSSAGAAEEYPRMDQDGFFALKADDFPSENDETAEP